MMKSEIWEFTMQSNEDCEQETPPNKETPWDMMLPLLCDYYDRKKYECATTVPSALKYQNCERCVHACVE